MIPKRPTDSAAPQSGRMPQRAPRALWRVLGVALLAGAGVAAHIGASAQGGQSSAPGSGPLDAVRNLFGGAPAQPELLPPDEAFRIAVRSGDGNTVIATLTPAKDYYLYRDRIAFGIVAPAGVSVDAVALPQGEQKADPTFGTVQVYHRPIEAVLTSRRRVAGAPKSACAPATRVATIRSACVTRRSRRRCRSRSAAAPGRACSTAAPAARSTPALAAPPAQPARRAGGLDDDTGRCTGCSPAAAGGRCWPRSSASACCSRSRRACCR